MKAFGAALVMNEEGGDCQIMIQVGSNQATFSDPTAAASAAKDMLEKEGWNDVERECFSMLKVMVEAAALSFDRVTRPSHMQ